jgi:dolichyl-phosphate beta-glucosyltransferase
VTAAPHLSVVIPAFNEADRLPSYLQEVVGFLERRGELWEVIVVDDGSTDGTGAVVRELAENQPSVRLLPFGRNRGKGAAVRAGMLAARGDLRLFADADGATPIAELKRLEAALGPDVDVVIGSRALPGPAVALRTRRHRMVAGRVFNWLAARLGVRAVADTQCGFKLFTAAAAEGLFGALETSGFGFEVELLLRAQKAGYHVVEVAVNWADQEGTKVGVLTAGPGMLVEIARARWRVGRS